MICAFGRFSDTKLGKEMYFTLNKRPDLSQSYDVGDIQFKL